MSTAMMVTKRSAHSFGEDDFREHPQPRRLLYAADPTPRDVPTHAAAMDTSVAVLSSSSSSTHDSISASSNSSTASTPSDAVFNAAIPSFLNSGVMPELTIDGPMPMPTGAPVNFGTVLHGFYRSGYPKPENYGFLQQLGLKTVVTLVDKNFSESYGTFMANNNIKHHMFNTKGTKKEEIPLITLEAILNLVLDRRNYPLLIHCNHGKHRTGCVVAVVRKITGWDSRSATDEYRAYAGRKERECDIDYIRSFELSSIPAVLTNPALDIRGLCEKSSSHGGQMPFGPLTPSNTTVGFRAPSFIRATFFSMTVLFIWVFSGFKMPASHRR